MAKKPTLQSALAKKDRPAPEPVPSPAGKPSKFDDGKMITSLRIDREKLLRLKVVAARQRVRVNDVIMEAIDNHLALYEDKAA
jgi:uncharacterized protein (DUF4415 family)